MMVNHQLLKSIFVYGLCWVHVLCSDDDDDDGILVVHHALPL